MKTEKLFQLSFPKYPTFRCFSKQMNKQTDRQTKNLNSISINSWDWSRRRCLPILIKISWKLIKISHISIFQWTNEPTDGHTNKKFFVGIKQSVRQIYGEIYTDFGKEILKTDQNSPFFHVSETNDPTDRHTSKKIQPKI